ncbi:MAG TPA: hypothetical protein VNZ85_20775 [Caulobacter sp.]|nr:hypothetical protein [Caulobacter sp.]
MAFVFGSGPGLSRLSIRAALLATLVAWPLSVSAQLPPPPKAISVDRNGVDARTGNETWSFPELDIGPEGEMGLHLARHHAEGVTRTSFDSTYYTVQQADGFYSASASFGNIGFGYTTISPGGGDANFIDAGSYRYQSANGTIVTFNTLLWDQNGAYGDNSEDIYRWADTVTYPSGVKLTLHYRVEMVGIMPTARIQSVTSNTGYQIKYRYASDTPNSAGFTQPSSAVGINMAVEYCNPDADDCTLSQAWPTVTYTKTANGINVTSPTGGVTQYSSTSPSPGFAITLPGNTTPNITFNYYPSRLDPCENVTNHAFFCSMGSSARVVSVVTPAKTTSYSYSSPNSALSDFDTITATEPGVASTVFKSQGATILGVWSVNDPLSRLTKYENDPGGLVTKATWPEGNFTEYQRDAYGRIHHQIAHSKGNTATLQLVQTFGPCAMGIVTCNLPLTVTDARNNLTEYRYNAHGQKTVELGPADQNNVRPLHRWFYSDRFAYTKNPAGALVATPTSVSVLASEIVCRASFNNNLVNPACGSTADEVVTTYEYPATAVENALLPRGVAVAADGVTRRVCFGYDRFGNKISETSPRAGLAACS